MATSLFFDTDRNLMNLIHFFDRFTNLICTGKGSRQDVMFRIPESYFKLNKNYENAYAESLKYISQMTKGKIIEIRELPGDIDLSNVNLVRTKEHFTLFNPQHQMAAGSLIGMLLKAKTEDLISLCVKINLMEVNPYMFEYALSVAILHRPDTQNIPLPSPTSYAPEFYFNLQSMRLVEREAEIYRDAENRRYVELTPTGTDMDPEHRLWYFREDAGVNMHHWHWHTVYPYDAGSSPEGYDAVNKDRRGELFYYMHAQIMARYNTERLINKLNRVKSFFYFRETITEPYFGKLDTPFMDTHLASRHNNAQLSDINRGQYNFKILDLELWRDRILEAIHNGHIIQGNTATPFEADPKGIDDLGNMIEASVLSKNQSFYGNLHNYGHMAIAYCHDPENKYLEDMAPMGDNRTAMRDPMFYRWHSFINDVFDTYKKKLPAYTADDLKFTGVQIKDFSVTSEVDMKLQFPALKNEFYTYMQRDLINVAFGTNIKFPGPAYILFPHLQHKDFQYNLHIYNDSDSNVTGTVRIFLAPATDETGTDTLLLNDQRRLFIELDKFVTPVLKARTTTTVTQLSRNSSVTIPFTQMFMDLDDVHNYVTKNKDPVAASKGSWCGCGWPHHMLIPKGKKSGYLCRLFVMITNHATDTVPGSSMDLSSSGCKTRCNNDKDELKTTAYSYCGKNRKPYPDKKPMYFPFDRQVAANATISDFVKPYPNMNVIDVKITFNDIKPMPEGPKIDPPEKRNRIRITC